jgi:hypothetical protein
MDLLIFLSFLELLDFFERYRMDDPVMKRTKGIMRINRLKGPRRSRLVCLFTFARNTAGRNEHHLTSLVSCRLIGNAL